MANTLMIAAGGGGDAITAAVLGPYLGLTDDRPVVMTYAWDRLIVDPLPGPRSTIDFAGLAELNGDVWEILSTTKPIPPAGSTLPQLAADLQARLLLLDPQRGAIGMARQVAAAAEYFGASQLTLVDVGGDILASGPDPGLRSPLADLLSAAACRVTNIPTRLLVPGPGIDGELSEATVIGRMKLLGGRQIAVADRVFASRFGEVFSWHPSEASGLFMIAARGARGAVEVRDAGSLVHLTELSTSIWEREAVDWETEGLISKLSATASLEEASFLTEQATGISELRYEVAKATQIYERVSHVIELEDLGRIDSLAAAAESRGADYITIRRLAEQLGIHHLTELQTLRRVLSKSRPHNSMWPVYKVRTSSENDWN